LIKKEEKKYGLSSNGTILAMNVLRLIEKLNSINNNFDFWKYHCIDDIPYESLKKIHLLQNAKVVTSTDDDLAKASNEYRSLISESNTVKVLLPIFSPVHLKSMMDCLSRDGSLELIVTNDILDFMKINGYGVKILSFVEKNCDSKVFRDCKQDFNETYGCNKANIKIWKFSKNLKLFLSSCDNFFSLGSFSDDGYYDDSAILIDSTEKGIVWSLEIFEHYKKYSEQINIKEYFDLVEVHE
jgi:predicted transcriptional regulator